MYKNKDIQWYNLKNDILCANAELVSPYAFYRDIFPEGTFEEVAPKRTTRFGNDVPNYDEVERKANTILVKIRHKADPKNPNKEIGASIKIVVTDDLEMVEDAKDDEFAIISPISYFGRSRSSKHADKIFALAIDLDGIHKKSQLIDLLHQTSTNSKGASPTGADRYLPAPTYIVNSGTGIHLYYVFEKPIKLYENVVDDLNAIKKVLTRRIWNKYLTSLVDNVQYQTIWQGYRVPGSASKLGKKYPVVAYKYGDKISVEKIIEYIPKSKDKGSLNGNHCLPLNFKFDYSDKRLTLEDSQEKYPSWYMERVIGGREKNKWHIKRDLYDWWLGKINEEATAGHRYFCIRALVAYAVKCDIDYYELEADAYSLLNPFDELSKSEDYKDRFHEKDIASALGYYGKNYDDVNLYNRKFISEDCAIEIHPSVRRNGRTQKEHMRRISLLRDGDYPNGSWREGNGRPKGSTVDVESSPKAQIIKEYLTFHPNASKKEIKEATGLTYPTIRKWFPLIMGSTK